VDIGRASFVAVDGALRIWAGRQLADAELTLLRIVGALTRVGDPLSFSSRLLLLLGEAVLLGGLAAWMATITRPL
jgi:hypothetical protein